MALVPNFTARELASYAGLYVAKSRNPRALIVRSAYMIEVGAEVSENEIATAVIAEMLGLDAAPADVRMVVEAYGFEYAERREAPASARRAASLDVSLRSPFLADVMRQGRELGQLAH